MCINCTNEDPDYSLRFKQELQEEKAVIGTKSESLKYAYLQKHLTVLSNALISVSGNEEFRSVLYSEVEKRFDGDYNALLSTLFLKIPGLDTRIDEEAPNKSDGSFKVSLDAFNNIVDGDELINLFPQIYIPYYATLKEYGKLGVGSPTIVAYNDSDSIEVVRGIKAKKNGFDFVFVDEEYAKKNEVWVVSLNHLNEQVANLNSGFPNFTPEDERGNESGRTQACTGLNQCNPSFSTWNDGRMYGLALYCDKEGWLAGNQDLYLSAASSYINHTNPYTGAPHPPRWLNAPDYKSIGLMGTGGACRTGLNIMIYQGWFKAGYDIPNSVLNTGDLMFYCFFEYDKWPASVKTFEVSRPDIVLGPNGYPITVVTRVYLSARTKESPFATGIMSSLPEAECSSLVCANDHPCQYRIDNGCMAAQFNGTL